MRFEIRNWLLWPTLLLFLMPAAAPGAPWTQQEPAFERGAVRAWVDGVPDTGQFLPDTVLLARVAGRRITVYDFRASYYDVYAPLRSATDSAGRVEFLNTLIDKAVLGEVVKPLPFEPRFEQRTALREYKNRVLSNVLFQRTVLDSCIPQDRDVRAFYEQLKQEAHIQRIQLASPAEAERLRASLISGRINWRRAVAEYDLGKSSDADGDLGWVNLFSLQEPLASQIAGLKVGGITAPVRTTEGFFLFRRVGTRAFQPPAYENVEKTLEIRLRNHLINQRSTALLERLTRELKLELDTANVRFAAGFYHPSMTSERKDNGVNAVTINADTPHFSAADNQRVLARWPGGEYTLGEFNRVITDMNPIARPPIQEADLLAEQVVLQALEPHRAELAIALGLESDSMAVAMLNARVEQYKAESLIEDSVMSRVQVSDAERRAYYAANERQFTTYPTVRFAAFATFSRASGDSLAELLRAGARPELLLQADSLAGRKLGSLQTRGRNEQGPFAKLLFEEMRPGQVVVEGPLSDKTFVVIKLLEFDSGKLLPYEDVREYADNHVRALNEEAAYQAFMKRQRSRVAIEARYDLLSRVRMVAPEL